MDVGLISAIGEYILSVSNKLVSIIPSLAEDCRR